VADWLVTALGGDVNMSINDTRLLHSVMLRRRRQQAAEGAAEPEGTPLCFIEEHF
jgi:hypothetical protein